MPKIKIISELNDKQRRFIDEYVKSRNSTQSAIKAGYSKKTAPQIGSRLLMHLDISQEIEKRIASVSKKADVSVERILAEYAKLAFHDVRKVFDKNGAMINPRDLDDDTAAAISGVEISDTYIGRGREKKKIGRLSKVKLADKKAALDSLAKYNGMFDGKRGVDDPEDKKDISVELKITEETVKSLIKHVKDEI